MMNTRHGRMKKFVIGTLLAGIFLTAILYAPVLADGEDLDFAYGTNHYNGAAYSSAMVPPAVEEFYLIADVDNIVAAKYTDVYYWALTNEYKANWDAANEIVDGSLEVYQGNKRYQTIERSRYVIQYDSLDKYGTITLFTGEDAAKARQNFEDMQTAYRDALYEYNEAMVTYRDEFQAALEKYQQGLITEDEFPVQPEKSEDMTLFSTEILEGFVVNLPQGSYTVQVRLPDGSIQADSQKKLVVFEAYQDGVSYNVLAEDRWTTPETSEDINETIYTVNENALYFQPYYAKQYNELHYLRMNDPQDKTARLDRYVWVPFTPVKDATIQVETSAGETSIAEKAYYVRQLLGSSLGYQIVEFDPENMTAASFEGYQLLTNAGEDRYFIELQDGQGEVLTGSSRRIHIISSDKNWMVYAVSFIPVAIGVLLILLRRKKVQYIKIVRE